MSNYVIIQDALNKVWDESELQGTPFKKKWFDRRMQDPNHPDFERMYVAFKNVKPREPSTLDEVTDSNVTIMLA